MENVTVEKGYALVYRILDIAEEIDPSALPASAEQTVVFDEARAPGHRHLPHGN